MALKKKKLENLKEKLAQKSNNKSSVIKLIGLPIIC